MHDAHARWKRCPNDQGYPAVPEQDVIGTDDRSLFYCPWTSAWARIFSATSMVLTASLKFELGCVPAFRQSMNSRCLAWKPPKTKNSSLLATARASNRTPTVSPSAYR